MTTEKNTQIADCAGEKPSRVTVTPTRRQERIAVELCTVAGCFAAVPVEQMQVHASWHASRLTVT